MPKLVVIAGNKKGTEIPLMDGETTIGRTPENTIRLTSNHVSRKHAVIVLQNGNGELRDLGSTSGTYVNGSKITSVALTAGLTFQIGEYAFQFVDGAGARTGTNSAPAVRTGGTGAAQPIKTGSRSRAVVAVPPGQRGGPRTGATRSGMSGARPARPSSSVAGQAEAKFLSMAWRNQVIFAITLVGLAGVAALGIFFARVTTEYNRYAMERARILTKNVALRNGEYLKRNQRLQLNVDEIKEEPGVKNVWILDRDLRVVVPANLLGRSLNIPSAGEALANLDLAEAELPDTGHQAFSYPIRVWDSERLSFETFGVAVVEFAPSEVANSLAATGTRMFGGVVLLLIAGIFGYILASRATKRPVARLQEDTELLVQGLIAEVRSSVKLHELQELAASINRLAQRGGPVVAQDAVSAAFGRQPQAQAALPGGTSTDQTSASAALIAMATVLPAAAVVVDDASNVLLINAAASSMLGLQPAQAKGKHLLEVVKDQPLVEGLLDVLAQLAKAPDLTAELEAGGRRLSATGVRSGNELAAAAVIIQ